MDFESSPIIKLFQKVTISTKVYSTSRGITTNCGTGTTIDSGHSMSIKYSPGICHSEKGHYCSSPFLTKVNRDFNR